MELLQIKSEFGIAWAGSNRSKNGDIRLRPILPSLIR
jgi:hypothetical protein